MYLSERATRSMATLFLLLVTSIEPPTDLQGMCEVESVHCFALCHLSFFSPPTRKISLSLLSRRTLVCCGALLYAPFSNFLFRFVRHTILRLSYLHSVLRRRGCPHSCSFTPHPYSLIGEGKEDGKEEKRDKETGLDLTSEDFRDRVHSCFRARGVERGSGE